VSWAFEVFDGHLDGYSRLFSDKGGAVDKAVDNSAYAAQKMVFNALSSATVVLVVIVITMVSKDAELRRGLGACILLVRLKFEAILVRLWLLYTCMELVMVYGIWQSLRRLEEFFVNGQKQSKSVVFYTVLIC